MVLGNEQRESLEEAVRLLESVGRGVAALEKPGFDDKRVESHVVTALSAARAALSVARGRDEPAEGGEPGA